MANIPKFSPTEAREILDKLKLLVNCMEEYTNEELGWTDEEFDEIYGHEMVEDFDLLP
jgi:hypothetical protein